MAERIEIPGSVDAITVDEFVRLCDAELDPLEERSILKLAPSLAALARNRSHLARIFQDQLSGWDTHASPSFFQANKHSEQTVVLARRAHYYVRLASWPVPKNRGDNGTTDSKFYGYGFAHNHAFSLLTAGVLGPGYLSTNYELSVPPRELTPGASVAIRREADQVLTEGCLLLYRKWRDIHIQHPPAAFSMSLNLMVGDSSLPQYSFDVATSTVGRFLAGAGHERHCMSELLRATSGIARK